MTISVKFIQKKFLETTFSVSYRDNYFFCGCDCSKIDKLQNIETQILIVYFILSYHICRYAYYFQKIWRMLS